MPISRYADPSVPGGSLTTSIVAVVTDVKREGKPVVGFGFSSFGRFGQSGLIRERFVPRLLAAGDLLTTSGDNFDPFQVWHCLIHVAAALGFGGTASNPCSFRPFGGFADDTTIEHGCVRPPNAPGIGFETRAQLRRALESLLQIPMD